VLNLSPVLWDNNATPLSALSLVVLTSEVWVLYTQEVWEAEAKSAPGRNIRLGIYAAVGGGSGLLAVGRVHAPPHPPPSALTLTLTPARAVSEPCL
jgi:hypothetical protein